jgi:hypothetical protein
MRKFTAITLLILAAFTTACSAVVPSTGDTAAQPLSAQSQMPSVPSGYLEIPADSIQTLLNTSITGANVSVGNLLGAGVVNRIDALVTCYREVGAIDFKGYASVQDAGGGLAVVINTSRVTDNLLACIAQAAGARSSSSAQSAFQPCVKTGAFKVESNGITNDFTYLYVGTTPNLCNAFQTHFTNKGG